MPLIYVLFVYRGRGRGCRLLTKDGSHKITANDSVFWLYSYLEVGLIRQIINVRLQITDYFILFYFGWGGTAQTIRVYSWLSVQESLLSVFMRQYRGPGIQLSLTLSDALSFQSSFWLFMAEGD